MSAEHQFEVKPFGSDAWELLEDWTEDGTILAAGYPVGVTGYRVRDRDSEDHDDVSDWVEIDATRTAEVVVPSESLEIIAIDFEFTRAVAVDLSFTLAIPVATTV